MTADVQLASQPPGRVSRGVVELPHIAMYPVAAAAVAIAGTVFAQLRGQQRGELEVRRAAADAGGLDEEQQLAEKRRVLAAAATVG